MSWCYSVLGMLYAFVISTETFTSEGVHEVQFLFSVSSAAEFNTSGVIPAVDLALDAVNNWSLPFHLSYNTTLDSQCDYQHSVQILQDALEEVSPSLVAVIGCGCSTATEAVVDVPELQSLPVISYASSSTFLKDENKYPNIFRTIPDSTDIIPAITKFIDFFNWKQTMVVSQEITTAEKLNMTLEQHNITAEVWTLSDPDLYQKDLIKNTSQRIFVLDVNVFAAQYYICQAYWSGKYYPGYAWIIVDNFAQWDWWKVDSSGGSDSVTCSQNQFETALNYSITVTPLSADYEQEMFKSKKFSAYACDAVRSLALALNKTSNYTPTNTSTTLNQTLLIKELSLVNFSGASGMVAFDSYGDRANTNIQFVQHRQYIGSFIAVTVATYVNEDIELTDNESITTIWPDGVPSDGIPVVALSQIHYAVLGLGIMYAVLGVTFSIGCLMFNIHYRNISLVRLTSPKLNYIFITGALLMYTSIILFTLPSFNPVIAEFLCELRAFVAFVLGYNICITVTLVKLWRLYYIFKNPKPGKKIPKDWHLVAIIILIIAPDFVINLTFQITDHIMGDAVLELNRERRPQINDSTGEVTEFYSWTCQKGTVNFLDSVLLLVHKFVIHVAALILIFRSRKIKIPALNDYKANSAIVFMESVVLLTLVAGLVILADYPTYFALMSSTALFIGSSSFLAFTFIPKMVALYKDPDGKKVFIADKQLQEEWQQNDGGVEAEMVEGVGNVNL